MNNTNTTYNVSIADTFRVERDARWAREHNYALDALYAGMVLGKTHLLNSFVSTRFSFNVLSLLNDIVLHNSCKRALHLDISDRLDDIKAYLANDYFADEVIQDCKRALDVWHAHSPNRSIPGVNGPVTSECIAARSDLADYALQLLNYEMGRIDCGTVDGIVRASVGQ